jgi:hypothetical protein
MVIDQLYGAGTQYLGANGCGQDMQVGKFWPDQFAIITKRIHSVELAVIVIKPRLPERAVLRASLISVSRPYGVT